eukprot:4765508-Prymnesium_polylepis.1
MDMHDASARNGRAGAGRRLAQRSTCVLAAPARAPTRRMRPPCTSSTSAPTSKPTACAARSPPTWHLGNHPNLADVQQEHQLVLLEDLDVEQLDHRHRRLPRRREQ